MLFSFLFIIISNSLTHSRSAKTLVEAEKEIPYSLRDLLIKWLKSLEHIPAMLSNFNIHVILFNLVSQLA
jgi:hypothetical protein